MKTYGDNTAFPRDNLKQIEYGLTKREFIAIMAMQGLLSNSHDNGMLKPLSMANRHEIAELAVSQADALIAELNKADEYK